MNIKASLNMGYTYRHRSTSEQVVRTYIFDKREAQTFKYYPSGMLTTKDTDFDPDSQVRFVRLGDGPFKDIEITFSSALDFERYHISEILVSLTHNPLTSGQTAISKTISLNKEKTSQTVYFLSQAFGMGVSGIDYTVQFIFDSSARMIGFGDSAPRDFSKTYHNVFDRSIEIDVKDLEEVVPVEVTLGNVTLEESGIRDISALLYSEGDETPMLLREVILQKNTTSEILLLNSQVNCRRDIVYRFTKDEFEGIQTNSRELRIVGEKSESNDIIVHSPTKGMIKVYPMMGDLTFEGDVVGIIVMLKRGSTVMNVNLSKVRTSSYLVVNYDQNNPEDISIESITVMRMDKETRAVTKELVEPLQKTITVEYTELPLPVF